MVAFFHTENALARGKGKTKTVKGARHVTGRSASSSRPKKKPRGKPFEPGKNSHTEETHHRGPDIVPRGSVKLMYQVVLRENREAIYAQLSKLCTTPRGALAFTEAAGDRLEGKPTQKHEHHVPRTTVFQRDPSAPPPRELGEGQPTPAAAEGVLLDKGGQAFVAVKD